MNSYALGIGYTMMIIGAPLAGGAILYAIYCFIMWMIGKVPPLRGALLHQLQLGRKAYLALPKDQRKGWPKR
jgi:uncharacterized membrane protein YccC